MRAKVLVVKIFTSFHRCQDQINEKPILNKSLSSSLLGLRIGLQSNHFNLLENQDYGEGYLIQFLFL